MQRRRFLQLAAGAAASGAVSRLSALPAPFLGLSLRSRPLLLPGTHATSISLIGEPTPTRREALGFVEMIWERRFDLPGDHYQWVINGQPYTESEPLPVLATHRYRLRVMNATGQQHSVYMQQHRLQLTRVSQTDVSRALQYKIDLARYSAVDADIIVS